MKTKTITIEKASFTRKEIMLQLLKFYVLWVIIGVISNLISVISQTMSIFSTASLISIITWLVTGIFFVSIFDYFLIIYHKASGLVFDEDGKRSEITSKFKDHTQKIQMKDVYQLLIQRKFTTNTDKIFIKHRKDGRIKTITLIINRTDTKHIEYMRKFIQ